jgi:hypothetical protein
LGTVANVVWIVGAGFSVPLGGPTLASLFSPHAHALLDAHYHSGDGTLGDARKAALGENATMARRLYLIGSRDDRGTLHHADREKRAKYSGMWGDAEEFLDTLETAALTEDGALARRLARVVGSLTSPNATPPIRDLRDAARKMLALECATFLHESDVASERWEPYRTWRDILQKDDTRKDGNQHTIITFNYDLVLEMLGLQDWVILPDRAPTKSCILKLHGSTNWKRGMKGEGFALETDPHFLATCRPNQLAIAPPGPSKATIVSDDFENLWKHAESRLGQADSIIFVGYRFPPTDSTARRRILTAANPEAGMNIVLGPSDPNGDVARLSGLLKFQSPNQVATVHRMWAQDFLGVCPTGLFGG